MNGYLWKDPFNRPLKVSTCCVVGGGTCILFKIVVQKVFDKLGVIADIEPTTEGDPAGAFIGGPDVIVMESLRIEEVRERYPNIMILQIDDLGNTDEIESIIINAFSSAGWIEKT
jgi:galactitol-specific phosphotransferase system IIB component